jgi:FkbH-like protein
MSGDRLSLLDLPWLPRLSPDFKSRLAAIQNNEDVDWGVALPALSQQALGLNQAISLSRVVRRLSGQRPTRSLTTFRLGIVSNATLDFIVPFLEATALRYGIALEVVTAPFDQAMQVALDPESIINAAKPDAVLLALDHRGLPFRRDNVGTWPPYTADAALRELDAIRQGIRRHSGAICLVQSVPAPLTPLFGSLDATLAGSSRAAISQFNTAVASDVSLRGDVMVDVDALAQAVGLGEWHNDRDWHLAKLPFARSALPLYADFVVRTIAAMRGKARKCLVLDLDNTLWGGVIGDDGLEGISIDQGEARGEAHRAVQAAALDLRRRGVVLAVCSKNDDAIARLPFREHSGMLLKEDDISVFVANWDDKASNLERIAQRLDIGLDSLVLLDDNPAERAQVRLSLPQVAVPELGDDPSTFVRTLMMAGYFESVAFTPEDLTRADQYRGNAHRAEMLEGSRDLGQFLLSLQMQIRFAPFQPQGRKRITQLINKTNQFNLTTRRYTEAQTAEMEASAAHYTLQVNLTDQFGDNGMICAIICHRGAGEWEIDSWLMSCRVLNRKVEEAICNRIARDAIDAGARRLVGVYRPTQRNKIVAGLFEQLGFSRIDSPEDDQRWVLQLDRFKPFEVPMSESP